MFIQFVEISIFSTLLFLSFIVISNPMRVNKKANIWFGLTLFLWSTFWIDEVYSFITKETINSSVKNIICLFQILTPTLLYISIVFYTNPNFKLKKLHYFIPNILFFLLIVFNEFIIIDLKFLFVVFIISNSIFFSVLSYFKIKKHQEKIIQFASNTYDINLKWLKRIITIILFLVVITTFFNFLNSGVPLNLFINIIMLLATYLIAYNILKQKEIYPINKSHRKKIIAIENIPNKRKIIDDEELLVYKNRLIELMEKECLYLNHDINLASLAEKTDVSPHQLSYIINNGFNQNFFQFINSYRVEKAKELLLDTSKEKLTILAIAYESGFNSKTAFNTTFKKITNETPTSFRKNSSHL